MTPEEECIKNAQNCKTTLSNEANSVLENKDLKFECGEDFEVDFDAQAIKEQRNDQNVEELVDESSLKEYLGEYGDINDFSSDNELGELESNWSDGEDMLDEMELQENKIKVQLKCAIIQDDVSEDVLKKPMSEEQKAYIQNFVKRIHLKHPEWDKLEKQDSEWFKQVVSSFTKVTN